MRMRQIGKRVLALGLVLCLVLVTNLGMAQDSPQEPSAPLAVVGTGFTYQGRLTEAGGPADGSHDFEFALYAGASGGNPLGMVTAGNVDVADGLFTVQLDFGSDAFKGEARYVELRVRPGTSTGGYTVLSPRQPLTPAPYALALPGLWTQQNGTSPNVLGGFSGNQVSGGAYGATIGGGGASGKTNRVQASYGTVGGGGENRAGGAASTVAGGFQNVASGSDAAVGGGRENTASGPYSTIGGGIGNQASGDFHATVSGGYQNRAENTDATVAGGSDNAATARAATVGGGQSNRASGQFSTVPGGLESRAEGDFSFAAGNQAVAAHDGAFVWADATTGSFASTGTNQFLVRASGGMGIGTNDPETDLHIRSGRPYVRFEDTDGGNKWEAGVFGQRQDFRISEMVGTTATARLVIKEGGKVQLSVLEITGGSDLAEPFDVVGPENVRPGMVMAIDGLHPGQLRVADRAYDSAVAGCVSGAHGVRPGLIMTQEGTAADGSVPVALSGRVYCWADAGGGPIQPGDLLTTSATPGHVMTVDDYERARGAIVGKAMSGLPAGRGLVLVLVTLQ